jgi:hypothetical protein
MALGVRLRFALELQRLRTESYQRHRGRRRGWCMLPLRGFAMEVLELKPAARNRGEGYLTLQNHQVGNKELNMSWD